MTYTHEAQFLSSTGSASNPVASGYGSGQFWTTTESYVPAQIHEQEAASFYDQSDALIETLAAIGEIATGVAAEGFTAGISTVLVFDGVFRLQNALKLIACNTNNTHIGKAIPSNGGALVGKIIDGMNGSKWDDTGIYSASFGLTNDIATTILSGGTAGAVAGGLNAELGILIRYSTVPTILSTYMGIFDDAQGLKDATHKYNTLMKIDNKVELLLRKQYKTSSSVLWLGGLFVLLGIWTFYPRSNSKHDFDLVKIFFPIVALSLVFFFIIIRPLIDMFSIKDLLVEVEETDSTIIGNTLRGKNIILINKSSELQTKYFYSVEYKCFLYVSKEGGKYYYIVERVTD